MAVMRVVDLAASSRRGFDEAVRNALDEARLAEAAAPGGREQVRRAWLNELSVRVKDGRIDEYSVQVKVTLAPGVV